MKSKEISLAFQNYKCNCGRTAVAFYLGDPVCSLCWFCKKKNERRLRKRKNG